MVFDGVCLGDERWNNRYGIGGELSVEGGWREDDMRYGKKG